MVNPQKGKWRGYITAAVIFGAALASFFAIEFLGGAADTRRQNQIDVIRFRGAASSLQVGLEAASVGEGIEEISQQKASLDAQYALLGLKVQNVRAKAFKKDFATYREAADRQLMAVKAGDMELAREIDEEIVDPAFNRVDANLALLGAKLSEEAEQWHAWASLASLSCLLLGALGVVIFVYKHQKEALSIFALESKQESVIASERRFRALVQNSVDVIVVVDSSGKTKLGGENANKLWGPTTEDSEDQPFYLKVHPDDRPRLVQLFEEVQREAHLELGTEVRIEGTIEQSGNCYSVQMVNLLEDPDVEGVLLTFHDITERKRFEEELSHQAFHDKLTGLPNRALFMDRLSHRLKSMRFGGVTMMFLDLDNFKVINDSLGHEAGDVMLLQCAERIQESLRASDTLARLGGDEFTILLDSNTPLEEATDIAKRIMQEFERPIQLIDREIFVTASIGIAASTEACEDSNGLVRDADTAMYKAKGNGKASYVVFDRSMNASAVERLEIEADLRGAIERGELVLHYQPILGIESGRLEEVEVLIRWQHPTKGLIPPLTFIPVAEETGLICGLGLWILRQACLQLTSWSTNFPEYDDLIVGVNVSGRQLQQANFPQQVADVLAETGMRPNRLKLEITESVMMGDLTKIRNVLEQLRATGIQIAIDDFGTGYSSMSYLSSLPVDTLKIDRSFVSALGDDRVEGIVKAIIAMATSMGLNVTSEGIETLGQLDSLKALGCDLGQGYLFAKPLSAKGITGLLTALPEKPIYHLAA